MRKGLLSLLAFSCAAGAWGQKPHAVAPQVQHLSRVEQHEVRVGSDGFRLPVKCDEDGNVYLRQGSSSVSPIARISYDGKQVSLISPPTDLNWSRFPYFNVDAAGAVHQLAYISREKEPYIVHYKRDGSYGSKTKIQAPPGTRVVAYQVASFLSGGFLVAGSAETPAEDSGKPGHPAFTAIVSDDGAIIKRLKLADDQKLDDAAEKSDKDVAFKNIVGGNDTAVNSGSAESAADGNVYVMRRITPAIVYAISPAGEVLRRFTVDPGSDNSALKPIALHISGSRMALLFDDNNGKQIIKVTTMTGDLMGTYDLPTGFDAPGAGLACYLAEKNEFIFLGHTENDNLALDVYAPR